MTAPTDPAAWLDELESLIPEARRGFMEDRAPEAAGFLVVATPKLVAAVRGVLALAEELDGSAAECGAIARELYGAGRPRLADSYGLKANAYADAADRLRAVVAAAHTEEGR